MRNRLVQTLIVSLVVSSPGLNVAADNKEPGPKEGAKSRHFEFTYATTVKGLPPGKTARIWIPVPSSSSVQKVTMDKDSINLPGYQIGEEKQYGNRILYVEARADDKGQIALRVSYNIKRFEVKTKDAPFLKPSTRDKIARLLEPDEKVPLVGKPLT